MRTGLVWVALALLPGGQGSAQVPGSAPDTPALLERYDFERRSGRFDLPGRLEEVSGLATTPDGRIFAHDDERGVVYELLPDAEETGKRFTLGDPPVRGDFEGITVVGERFFMVTSRGLLYEFREMPDGGDAPYRVTDTELGAHCEIEGLDYDAEDDVFLFACKVSAPDRGSLVVHRLPGGPERGGAPPLLVDRRGLSPYGIDPGFAPSAVAVSPSGTLLVLSATVPALVEVDRSGRVLAAVALSRDRHRQPEGLTFGPDGTLYVADEGDGRDARLTAYAPRQADH